MSIIIITSITINIEYDNYMQYYKFKLSSENTINFQKEAENIPCKNIEDINNLL